MEVQADWFFPVDVAPAVPNVQAGWLGGNGARAARGNGYELSHGSIAKVVRHEFPPCPPKGPQHNSAFTIGSTEMSSRDPQTVRKLIETGVSSFEEILLFF